MARAFLAPPAEGEPVETAAVHCSVGAAEAFVDADPFVQAGLVQKWTIREWAGMLG